MQAKYIAEREKLLKEEQDHRRNIMLQRLKHQTEVEERVSNSILIIIKHLIEKTSSSRSLKAEAARS